MTKKISFSFSRVFGKPVTVTGSRSIGTVFQNLTGIPLLVRITCQINTGSVTAMTDGSNPPTTGVATISATGALGAGEYVPMEFIVLPRNFYKLNLDSGTAILQGWGEWR